MDGRSLDEGWSLVGILGTVVNVLIPIPPPLSVAKLTLIANDAESVDSGIQRGPIGLTNFVGI